MSLLRRINFLSQQLNIYNMDLLKYQMRNFQQTSDVFYYKISSMASNLLCLEPNKTRKQPLIFFPNIIESIFLYAFMLKQNLFMYKHIAVVLEKVCSYFCLKIFILKIKYWASLVAQWLRICLLMQGTGVRALVWEDPTCHGAAGPVSHNY